MDELEESEVKRQLFLRDPTVRPQPTPQQRPKSFQRVDVRLTETVAVVVARVFALGVADRAMVATPIMETTVDVVFVGNRPRSPR